MKAPHSKGGISKQWERAVIEGWEERKALGTTAEVKGSEAMETEVKEGKELQKEN